MQSHFFLNAPTKEQLTETFKTFTSMGYKVMLTEMDNFTSKPASDEAADAKQKEQFIGVVSAIDHQ